LQSSVVVLVQQWDGGSDYIGGVRFQ
jgi:hypothetical protein